LPLSTVATSSNHTFPSHTFRNHTFPNHTFGAFFFGETKAEHGMASGGFVRRLQATARAKSAASE
jgi:hypothetical protein